MWVMTTLLTQIIVRVMFQVEYQKKHNYARKEKVPVKSSKKVPAKKATDKNPLWL